MSDTLHGRAGSAFAIAAATMLALDVTWLGVVARGLYDSMLGPLKRTEVFWPAAALFYAMYISAVMVQRSSVPAAPPRRFVAARPLAS